MKTPFRPSNATDGESFEAHFCGNCAKRDGCRIPALARAYQGDDPQYPPEWIEAGDDGATCTAFDPRQFPAPR